MILQINKDYRINTDELNFIVEQKVDNKWQEISFHPSLGNAINWVFRRELLMADAKGPAEILAAIEKAQKMILDALRVRTEQMSLFGEIGTTNREGRSA